ncbi:MAG: phosphotransferase [Acidimicrobiales bacterium]
MYTRPPELADDTIVASLAEHWHIDPVELSYEPVGFGAHHWKATDTEGIELFLTVHDLTAHRNHDTESEDGVFRRLTASFTAARALHDGGLTAVLAPTPTADGRIVDRMDSQFTLAVHPFLHGRPAGAFGGFTAPVDRREALDLVVDVHRHTELAAPHADEDDLVVPHTGEIPVALDELGTAWDAGPYAGSARGHLAAHAPGVQRLLVRYEQLAEEVRQRDGRVLTHGEPHAANVLVVGDRRLLIDWDTALVAVPERDLWHLDPGDGSILEAYRDATGVTPSPAAVDLYRLWWDLTEIGGYLGVLRRPHTDTTDVAMAWKGLQEYCDPAARWPGLVG